MTKMFVLSGSVFLHTCNKKNIRKVLSIVSTIGTQLAQKITEVVFILICLVVLGKVFITKISI